MRAVKSSPGPEWGTTCKGEIPPGLELNGFFFGFPRRTLDDMACASSGPHGTRTQQGFGVIGCPVRRGSYGCERPKGEHVSIDSPDAPMLRLRVAKKPSPLLHVGLALLRPQLLTKWQTL